jgi:hypothetical protein
MAELAAQSLAANAVTVDLNSARFRAGVKQGRWHVVSQNFPLLYVAVSATEPGGAKSEYFFQFELTNFPGQAPEVYIWDVAENCLLPVAKRPKGPPRTVEAFKDWGSKTVYRPWERRAAAHNNWVSTYQKFLWHPKRDLAFAMEDLHDVLNLNAYAAGARAAA